VRNAFVLPACGQSGAARTWQNIMKPRWFGPILRSVYFAPQPPSGASNFQIATQAGGSAGPLPADPLFFYLVPHSVGDLKPQDFAAI
jgi:hypothetical protein